MENKRKLNEKQVIIKGKYVKWKVQTGNLQCNKSNWETEIITSEKLDKIINN